MHLASADEDHDLVAGLLQREPTLDDLRMRAGHLDGAVEAEEVRSVEHVNVERVALDPLAAVEEPPQHLDRLTDFDAAGVLHRLDGAHLVRDRTDPANARGDVGRLEERATAEERLEEPGRLEDPQFHLVDLAVDDPHGHRALTLDPGEVVSLDRAAYRRAHLACGTPPR